MKIPPIPLIDIEAQTKNREFQFFVLRLRLFDLIGQVKQSKPEDHVTPEYYDNLIMIWWLKLQLVTHNLNPHITIEKGENLLKFLRGKQAALEYQSENGHSEDYKIKEELFFVKLQIEYYKPFADFNIDADKYEYIEILKEKKLWITNNRSDLSTLEKEKELFYIDHELKERIEIMGQHKNTIILKKALENGINTSELKKTIPAKNAIQENYNTTQERVQDYNKILSIQSALKDSYMIEVFHKQLEMPEFLHKINSDILHYTLPQLLKIEIIFGLYASIESDNEFKNHYLGINSSPKVKISNIDADTIINKNVYRFRSEIKVLERIRDLMLIEMFSSPVDIDTFQMLAKEPSRQFSKFDIDCIEKIQALFLNIKAKNEFLNHYLVNRKLIR